MSALSALSALALTAGCGINEVGTLDTDVSPTMPGPPTDPSVPSKGEDPVADAGTGADTSLPVAPCSDTTLAFDGIDDHGTVPDDFGLDLAGDFTVEAWIKPGAKATAGAEMDVVSHHDAPNSRGWVLLVKDGRVEIVVYGDELGNKGFSAGNAGAPYVVVGKWAHVAGTLKDKTLRVYYDGKLRDTQQLATFFGRSSYAGALRFGRASYAEDLRFAGEIDDVRLSTIARYTGATAPKPAALLSIDDATEAAWRFDEPKGTTTLIDSATKRKHDGSLAPDATQPTRLASTCIKDR